MKYFLFIGRWAPFHEGHKYIIDSFVGNNKPVCIAIRESEEKYPVQLRKQMIEAVYTEYIKQGLVKVITIPDIEGVCVGRKVGYSIIEVPQQIKTISGTKVRQGKCNQVPQVVKEIITKWENTVN